MKELLKNKWMIGFTIATLLLTFVVSLKDKKIDEQKKELGATTQQVLFVK